MSEKPKLLLLVTLSDRGGAQEVVYRLACGLRDTFEVTVGCGPGGPLIQRLRYEGIHVVELPFVRNFHPWQDLRAFLQLRRWLREEPFAIVHTHSTKAGLLGRLAAHAVGVPVVLFTAHGWAFTEGRPSWLRWLLALMERLVARRTSKIICVSEHDRQLALAFRVAESQQLVVIQNGVDPEPFWQAETSGARAALRQAWGVSADEPVVTFVGRLASQKDPDTLLAALSRVRRVRAMLVGDGPLRPRIEAFLQSKGLEGRVQLLGERTDVPDILVASDVFVLSSRWEGFPLTVIEAMLAGLPVVASRVGGVPELVEDGITGLLVPPRDPVGLAAALQQLLDDAALRRRMGEAGRQRALERFTLETMLQKYRDVYAEVLARRGVQGTLTAHEEAKSRFS